MSASSASYLMLLGALRIPMRGYELTDVMYRLSIDHVTNPHAGL